jgi:Xaa-Pro aminopeptidase
VHALQVLAKEGVDLLAITQPDNIAWLLNIRGSDVAMNPVAHAFALLSRDGEMEWFIDRRKRMPIGCAEIVPADLRMDRFSTPLPTGGGRQESVLDADYAPVAPFCYRTQWWRSGLACGSHPRYQSAQNLLSWRLS